MVVEDPRDSIDDPHLDSIVRESKRLGTISKREQALLVMQAQKGDEKAMQTLLLLYARYCIKAARAKLGMGVELLDLFGEAQLGFHEAIMRFDPTNGYGLLTYAQWWVRQRLWLAAAEKSRTIALTRTQVSNWIKIRDVIRAGQNQNRFVSLDEIMEKTGLGRKTVILHLGSNYGQDSLNVHIPGGEREDETLQDRVESPRVDDWIDAEETDWLHDLISTALTRREARILRGYFYEGLTLDQLRPRAGGVTRERVRQLKNKALAKVSVAIAEHDKRAGLTTSDRIDLLGSFKEGNTK